MRDPLSSIINYLLQTFNNERNLYPLEPVFKFFGSHDYGVMGLIEDEKEG